MAVIEILTGTREAWHDYRHWQQHNPAILQRVNRLILATRTTPFSGIGKPMALQGSLTSLWSRRIDENNRLIYAVDGNRLTILSCRYHFECLNNLNSSR